MIKKNLGISLSVGLFSGIWVLLADLLGVPAWPAFIGWSIFFFTGANLKACKVSFPCIALGAILAYLTVDTQTTLGTVGITSAIVVFGLGFSMTIAKSFSFFEIAPATFIAANVYFASGSLFYSIAVTSVGLILGPISIKLGALFDSFILKNEKTEKAA